MRRVLDSCVGFKWHLQETDSDKVLRIRDDFLNGRVDLLAPDILPIEIGHALTRAGRQGRISPADGLIHLHDMLITSPDLCTSLPLLPRAYAISSLARIGIYDCLYVALAEREGCESITADERLVRALQPTFPFVTALAALP